jgi:hypothetical protein
VKLTSPNALVYGHPNTHSPHLPEPQVTSNPTPDTLTEPSTMNPQQQTLTLQPNPKP